MGLPTVGQVSNTGTVSHCAFWPRAYNLIWNEWFRDENLQNSVTVDTGDGPDNVANYTLLRRGKRKDYFTSALPWPQKGTSVTLPLGTSAPIYRTNNAPATRAYNAGTNVVANPADLYIGVGGDLNNNASSQFYSLDPNGGLYADLSAATSATINQLRQSFQIQKLLERVLGS